MSFKDLFKRAFYDYRWICAFRKIEDTEIACLPKDKEYDYHVINVPEYHWAADPFLFKKDGELYAFFEYTNVKQYKSYLAAKRILPIEGAVFPIYEFKGHSSYPCIFEWNGKIYIIPENLLDSRSVRLLKCVEWPNKWEEVSILLNDIDAADTTPFIIENTMHLFVYTIEDSKNPHRILYSCELDIDKGNVSNLKPIKTYTTRDGRPGGATLYYDGEIIRVVQPGHKYYGEKIEFYKVDFNQDGKYTETLCGDFKPNQIKLDQNIIINGVHTFNRLDEYEIIDAREIWKFDIFRPFKKVFQKCGLFGYADKDRNHEYIFKNMPMHLSKQ